MAGCDGGGLVGGWLLGPAAGVAGGRGRQAGWVDGLNGRWQRLGPCQCPAPRGGVPGLRGAPRSGFDLICNAQRRVSTRGLQRTNSSQPPFLAGPPSARNSIRVKSPPPPPKPAPHKPRGLRVSGVCEGAAGWMDWAGAPRRETKAIAHPAASQVGRPGHHPCAWGTPDEHGPPCNYRPRTQPGTKGSRVRGKQAHPPIKSHTPPIS
jgi:hypothetical protein